VPVLHDALAWVVCELRERGLPDPARLYLLRARGGKCALSREQVDEQADAGAVATERGVLGRLRAREQIIRCIYPLGRSL